MQEIKDSGQRSEFPTGFVRDMHEGKGRFDLLPWRAIWEGAIHCENGAIKYGERNIDKGAPQHSLIDSAIRHLAKYLMGWDDEPHLRAAWWNISWALEQEVVRPDMQDIPSRMKKEAVVPQDMMRDLVDKARVIQEQKEALLEVFAKGGLVKPPSEDVAEMFVPHGTAEAYKKRFEEIGIEATVVEMEEPEKKRTNGDRIRAMSDEELAEFAVKALVCECCPLDKDCKDEEKCKEQILEYLQADEKEE